MSQPGPMAESQPPEATSAPEQSGATEPQGASTLTTNVLLLPAAPEALALPPVEPASDVPAAQADREDAGVHQAPPSEQPSATLVESQPDEAADAAAPAQAGQPHDLPAPEAVDAVPSGDAEPSHDGPVPEAEVAAPAEQSDVEPDDEPAEPPPSEDVEAQATEAATADEQSEVEPDDEPAEPPPSEDVEAQATEAAAADEQPAVSEPARREDPSARPEVPPAPSFTSETPRRGQRAGMMALLKLDKVDEDDTFRLRADGDIDSLATSIARLGQLFPVELRLKPPDRFQVICGFRRVAALRLLKRERVVARVYTDIGEEDALQLALADLLESRAFDHDELVALRDRLASENRLSGSIADTLDRALSPPGDTLCPETVDGPEEEVDLDELAKDVLGRLATVNQDLALVVELWNALEPGLRDALLEQLGYPEQLGSYLRSLR